MNRNEREISERLDAMSIEDARKATAAGEFGAFDSPNQNFALSWLACREAELRDLREESTQSFARHAAYAAYAAAIIASISIIMDILQSW